MEPNEREATQATGQWPSHVAHGIRDRGNQTGEQASRVLASRRFLLSFGPLLFFTLHVKHAVLEWDGFRIYACQLGYFNQADLTLRDKLPFYANDVLVVGLLLPLFATILMRSTRGPRVRIRRTGLIVAQCLAILVLFIQLQAFYLTGTFTSLPMSLSAAAYGASHPDEIQTYVPVAAVAKLLLLFGATIATTCWALRSGRTPTRAASSAVTL